MPSLEVDAQLILLEAALDGARLEDALSHALAAWRKAKTPELAALVEVVAAAAEANEPPLEASKGASQEARWKARATEKRPVSLARLLDPVLDRGPNVARSRVAMLEGFAPDPRLVAKYLAWLETPPVHDGGRARFFPTVIAQLILQGEPSVLARLDPMLTPETRADTIARIGLRPLTQLRAARETLSKLSIAPPLSSNTLETARRLAHRVTAIVTAPRPAKRLRADLLADVHAHPEDDVRRLVYADALGDEGDERGEFIALQCARAKNGTPPTRREKELLRVYEREWLGAIEPVILKTGVRYERGFPVAGRLLHERLGPAPYDAPEWSTFVELDVERQATLATGARDLLLRPHLRSLRRVHGAQIEDVAAIAAHDAPLPWDELSVRCWRNGLRQLRDVFARGLETLPSLSVLGFVLQAPSTDMLEVILSGPLATRLRRLFLVGDVDEVATVRGLVAAAPNLEQLELSFPHFTLQLSRTGSGSGSGISSGSARALDQVDVVLEAASGPIMGVARRALMGLAPLGVSALRLRCDGAGVEGDELVLGKRRASLAPLQEIAGLLRVTLEGPLPVRRPSQSPS